VLNLQKKLYKVGHVASRHPQSMKMELCGRTKARRQIQMGGDGADGKKVMQFLDGGRYMAVFADGKMKIYR
jgi:hypothetical protein